MRAAASLRRLRELYSGQRLVIAVVVGLLAYALGPASLGASLDVTLAWVCGVAGYLVLTLLAIGGSTPERVRTRARALDERAWVILALTVSAAVVSLGALGFVLQKGAAPSATRVALTCLAVALSWLLAHTTFALHYAHLYYDDVDNRGGPDRGGLQFPGTEPPDYWDFIYYAFVVGMTCQVSDVQVTSRAMRRLTLVHGVLAFFFNTGVLALAVNILASAL